MKSKMLMLALMAGAFGGTANKSDLRSEDIDTTPKEPPIPKGCKRYYFYDDGTFIHTQSYQSVFNCIARTDKKAKEKFNKFNSQP